MSKFRENQRVKIVEPGLLDNTYGKVLEYDNRSDLYTVYSELFEDEVTLEEQDMVIE